MRGEVTRSPRLGPSAGARLEGARVLLVEDNQYLAENLAEILSEEGADVRLARSAAESREFRDANYDVALVDVRLPDASGLDVLAALKDAGDGRGEIILVTGNATIEDAIGAVHGRAYAYVLKPFASDDLIGHAERAYRQVRSSREADALAAKLAVSEERLRTLVDTVQALLIVLDGEGVVTSVNPAAAALTGFSASDLVGARWIDRFVPGSDREAVRAVFDRLVAGAQNVSLQSRVLGCRAGDENVSEHWVNWRFSTLRDEAGQLRVYASGVDITELKELQRRSQLAERMEAVGTMTAGLAHEVRNPLNSANLQLSVLERRLARQGAAAELSQPVRLVREEIERLSRLLNDFLEFARPHELRIERIELSALLRDVIELQRHVAAEEGVELACVCAGSLEIQGDRAKLTQVVLNLVRNAIEAADTGGRVQVSCERDGAGARIEVRDTGAGIPADLIDRVFEPFFTTKPAGTGLGMAICYNLVAQHGGTVQVHNDDGAVFVVTLPARQE